MRTGVQCWPPLLSRGGQGSADQVRCLLNTVCLDYSSTRGLSPSRCWLVLRQHRSEPQGSDLNCDPPVSFPASGLLRCWPPSFRGVMLVAGGDPGFWHGPWPYLPGCAGEDHCRRQVPLYVLSHHHCAFTNKKKSDPRRMFVGPTGIRSCYPRASTVLHARALSCWPRTLTRSGLQAISRRLLGLPQPAMPVRIRGLRPTQANPSSPFG